MKQETLNSLVKVRDSLFYRITKSECLCDVCKEDLETKIDELNKIIEEAYEK